MKTRYVAVLVVVLAVAYGQSAEQVPQRTLVAPVSKIAIDSSKSQSDEAVDEQSRVKRAPLLGKALLGGAITKGALGIGALGAGALGIGVLGAGALGAGALGAGVVGAGLYKSG